MKHYNNNETLVLSHYYTSQETQAMAHFVGDSLELAKKVQELKPKRVVFASVRFMAEQAKILSPSTEVILPHPDSSCSLVDMTDVHKLLKWKEKFEEQYNDVELVSYVNSSAQQKMISDIIVTSANVVEIVTSLINQGKKVLFASDKNMGSYLKYELKLDIEIWNDAMCIVHDSFNLNALEKDMRAWTDGAKYIIAHPESPLRILQKADYVGSTSKMLKWIENFPNKVGTIYVATEEGIIPTMKKIRPALDIIQVPSYNDGCACSRCPFMRLNSPELVEQAIAGTGGVTIDYLTEEEITKAYKPIKRMLEFEI